MGLPGLGWVEEGSKGAVLSMEVRCTQLLGHVCLVEWLTHLSPPPPPSVPHALGLPLWTLGHVFLGVCGCIFGLCSLCQLPAP